MRRVVAASLAVALLVSAGAGHAQPKKGPGAAPSLASSFTGEARQSYETARALFQKGDYHAALDALQRTQRLSPDPRLFWNIAACEKKLGRHARAIADVERYLSSSASLLTANDKREAEQFLAAARAYVAIVTITGNVEGTEILVDGEVVATTPLPKPIPVDEGEHTIRFARPTYRSVERIEKVIGGSELRWIAQLEPLAPATPAVVPPPVVPPVVARDKDPEKEARPPTDAPSRVGPLLVGGAGVLLAGTGAVLVGLSLGDASTVESECGTTCPPSRWEKYRTLQTAGDVLLIAGGAAVLLGVTWLVLQPSARSTRSARLVPTPYGLLLEGTL